MAANLRFSRFVPAASASRTTLHCSRALSTSTTKALNGRTSAEDLLDVIGTPSTPLSSFSRSAEPDDALSAVLNTSSPSTSTRSTLLGTPFPPPRDQPRPFRTTSSGTNPAQNLLKMQQEREHVAKSVEKANFRKDLERQLPRRWRVGDVYAPGDLSARAMASFKPKRKRPAVDVFDALAMNPLKEYKNFAIMSEFMSEMGRIKHSNDTGLRPVNQRRIAKAIRRSIGLGLMPSVHRHPELLESRSRYRQRDGI